MTLKKDIENYIRQHANSTSISRAKGYEPAFSDFRERKMSFICRGSDDSIYIQTVDFTGADIDSIRTSCNCPYQGSGICKHAIASLRVFATIMGELPDAVNSKMGNSKTEKPVTASNKTTKKTTNKTTKQKSKKHLLKYPLVNGAMDAKAIIKDFHEHGCRDSYQRNYNSCYITHFEENKYIKTKTSNYRDRHTQTFRNDSSTNQLTIECNCRKYSYNKTYHCDHALIAVEFLAEKLGANCLQKDFFLHKANAILQQYGLTTDDDYQAFFKFFINEDGFYAEKKVENLLPLGINPLAGFTKSEDDSEDSLENNSNNANKLSTKLLPHKFRQNTQTEFGMGVIFEFDGREFEEIVFVEGKYDKYRTQLATRFTVLNDYNFNGYFYKNKHSEFDKQIFQKVQEFEFLTGYSFESMNMEEEEQIVSAIAIVHDIGEMVKKHNASNASKGTNYPVFIHEVRNSYTKKNLTLSQFNQTNKVSLQFQFTEDDIFYNLIAKVKIGDKILQADSNKLYVNMFFLRYNDEIYTYDNPQLACDLVRYNDMAKISFLKKDKAKFVENVLLPLSQHYEITGKTIKTVKPSKKTANKASKLSNKKAVNKDVDKKTVNKATNKTTNKTPNELAQLNDLTPKKQVYISEQDGLIFFRLAVQYPEKMLDPHSHELRLQINDNGEFEQLPRDSVLEQEFIQLFKSLHPSFNGDGLHKNRDDNDSVGSDLINSDLVNGQDDEYNDFGIYVLQPPQLIEDFWLLDTAKVLQEHDVEILGFKELKSFNYNLHKPTLSMSMKSDVDWFDVELDVSFGEQKVNLKDLQKAFVKKQDFVELGDGTIGMLPEKWVSQFSQYFKVGTVKKDKIQISNYQFGVIDELYQQMEDKPQFLVELYERKQRLQDLHLKEDVAIPEGIQAELRPYQKHGLNWMCFLHENQLGGCLADDMGLGKTLQTITFLQHLKLLEREDRELQVKKKRTKAQKSKLQAEPFSTSLIVAPTSLVFNWQNEIEKFCPTLSILNFTGAKRKEALADGVDNFAKHIADYDLIITTYGSLVNDIDILKDYQFNYVILDESQSIKNPQSQRYKAVRLLKANNRLILTGTPIENNTFDLYAQFNFINPGLLGNTTNFRKEFAEAIDKNKDVETSNLLAKLVNPFILRRTKEQVATELPPKVENVMYCEMGSKQRKVYNAMKQQYRDYLLGTIEDKGIEKSQMYILDGLMKLRQICNSPAILSGDADYGDDSIKLEMLTENIKEKTGQHKILVFSTFVKMLKLIKTRLQAEGIECEYLDGQTRNRQAKVDNFQNNDDVRVFLISTKAGGTGLNLTEADYVFIVDPWWNPAVENQAIDRSYRIGQTKHVMAYRMICKDSIEEKILELQESKRGIAKSIINVDEEKKSFDVDEVKALFA